MKSIHLTQSEINRADKSYSIPEYKYTIIRRPQSNGKYWIAAVDIQTCKVYQSVYVDSKEYVRAGIHEVNRWMDKLANGGKMSYKSRSRHKKDLTCLL